MSRHNAIEVLCILSPLCKQGSTSGKCRPASQTNVDISCSMLLLLCMSIPHKVILSKAGGHAAQGHACRYHSVCIHPIGLPTLSGRRGVLGDATGLPQVVNHRVDRGR